MEIVKVPVGPVTVDLLADDRICIGLKAGKSFEPVTREAWASMCKPGTTIIDVGCYSGLFAIAAAKLGAIPIGIEPLPFMRKRIAENAAINGVKFRVVPAAASDRSGRSRIGYNEKVHLTSGASLHRSQGHGIMVDTITLDDLNPGPVAAIKIDVERHEAAVIRGAMNIILRDKPRLVVEFLDDAARDEIVSLLPHYSVRVEDRRNLIMSCEKP